MAEPVEVARTVATETLLRVSKGSYAAPVLDSEIARSNLNARDRALATELVYGTLRTVGVIDAWFGETRKNQKAVDPLALAAVRVAIYQLLFLDRTPAHAAVNAAVGIVRKKRGQRLAGFVNASLRNIVRRASAETLPARKLYCPPWIVESLESSLGSQRIKTVFEQPTLTPLIGLRFFGQGSLSEHCEALEKAQPGVKFETSTLAERCIQTQNAGDLRKIEGYEQGLFQVQEEGSQLVGELVGIKPGDKVADLCAGHGGKTAVFADALQGTGRLVAADTAPVKLEQLTQNMKRLGMSTENLQTHSVDLRIGTGRIPDGNDIVFVDAPCSGLGTLYRRPERMLHCQAKDLKKFQALQFSILQRALTLVRPGGRLVYAVCSPCKEEGIEVVKKIMAAEPKLQIFRPVGAIEPDSDGMFRTGPWLRKDRCGPDLFQMIFWQLGD